jgi:uncharacterized membrane protein YkgB
MFYRVMQLKSYNIYGYSGIVALVFKEILILTGGCVVAMEQNARGFVDRGLYLFPAFWAKYHKSIS